MIRFLHFFLIFLIPALITKAIPYFKLNVTAKPTDYINSGSASVAVALLFAMICVKAQPLSKLKTAFVVVTGWILACVHYSNLEHVLELDAVVNLMDIHYLTDPTFFKGSALQTSYPMLLVGLLAGIVILAVRAKNYPPPRVYWPAPCIALVLIVTSLVNRNFEVRRWRQSDPISYNVVASASQLVALWDRSSIAEENKGTVVFKEELPEPSVEEKARIDRLLKGDLNSGRSFLADKKPAGKSNVLVILIEGMSGAFIDGFGAESDDRVKMPLVSKWAKRGIVYNNHINHNRRTDNGTFGLLCGRYPNIKDHSSKIYNAVFSPKNRKPYCLPKFLAERGYHTTYLQAATLVFMEKDKFMPIAGFERTLGRPWFNNIAARGHWGVDDKTFFQNALRLVRELEAKDQPWMSTLLTVGTHHPVTIPADWHRDYEKRVSEDKKAASFAFADEALDEFLSELDKMGVFENTLVVLTSDESVGLSNGTDNQISMSNNFGPMIVFEPGKTKKSVDAPTMQTDLALSVTDYLGYPEGEDYFWGRSIFRSYDEPRDLPMGYIHHDRFGMLTAKNEMVVCKEKSDNCQMYRNLNPYVFASPFSDPQPMSANNLSVLKHFLARSEQAESEISGAGRLFGEYDLIGENLIEMKEGASLEWLVKMEIDDIPGKTELSFSADLELIEGSAFVRVGVISFIDSKEVVLTRTKSIDLEKNNSLKARLKYRLQRPREEIRVYLRAGTGGKTAKIDLKRATLKIDRAYGIVVDEIESARIVKIDHAGNSEVIRL